MEGKGGTPCLTDCHRETISCKSNSKRHRNVHKSDGNMFHLFALPRMAEFLDKFIDCVVNCLGNGRKDQY